MTARDVDRDVSAAKRSAASEPVFITDRGRPSHVLLTVEEHQRLVADRRSIVDRLSAEDDVDLETRPVNLRLSVPDL